MHHTTVNQRRYTALRTKARSYITHLERAVVDVSYMHPESSLAISGDAVYQQGVQRTIAPLLGAKHVILIGIGGSSLGTQAVYDALKSHTSPSLTVLDTIHEPALEELAQTFKKTRSENDIAVIITSKSGTTTETIANAGAVIEIGTARFGASFSKRVLCIGGRDTDLARAAKKRKYRFLSIPESIGGRYSLFTAAHIAPLTLLGIDTKALCAGSRDAVRIENMEKTGETAALLATHAEAGVHTVNFFTFSDQLISVGMWYRQLLAESVGKSHTRKKKPFTHALLPIVSTAADLHSSAQLYLSGHPGIVTRFISIRETKDITRTIAPDTLLAHLPFLADHSLGAVQQAIRDGVLRAYDEKKLPYQNLELERCDAYTIGYLLTTFMVETMCLAHISDVDAFDQPAVELYKKHAREALG